MIGSKPEDGAVVATAPNAIEMQFKQPVRLTKVTITSDATQVVAIDLSGAKAFADAFNLPLVGAPSGPIKIEWRALAQDGHAMKGKFSFTVA